MSKEEIKTILIEELSTAQSEAGEDQTPITEDTVPIGDLQGFDSLTSVAVTCQCLDRFGLDKHTEITSIFIGKDNSGNSCALNVAQVANNIVELLA